MAIEQQIFDQAVFEWQELLGAEFVLTSKEALAAYARSTLPATASPAAIVKPKNREEVQAVVCIANRFKIPLYPISCGKNWGYGSASPVSDGQVIVELSRMNRIESVNEKLAYAVIEPGVTQEQLQLYLRENGHDLWLDITGAGPNASVIGNTVERGFGHTPLADHFHTSCGYEIVTAEGATFTTGFGHFKTATTTHLFKAGIGPALDGLFTQSNFGIVTKMGIWLMPKPKRLVAYFLMMPNNQTLQRVIEALRPLRMSGVLQSALHIGNDLRVISSAQTYPWQQTDGKVPLPNYLREQIRAQRGFALWNALGALYGDDNTVRAAKKSLCQALKGIAKPIFLDESKVRFAKTILKFLPTVGIVRTLKQRVSSIEPVFELLQGTPSSESLRGIYWRTRGETFNDISDPDASNAGLMWLSPVIPMLGDSVADFLGLIEPIYKEHGFDPLITFTMLNARTLCSVLSVNFDKAAPAEAAQAQACYDALLSGLLEAGYIPYRTSTQSMNKIVDSDDLYWTFASRLKLAVDPNRILAPGRYSLI